MAEPLLKRTFSKLRGKDRSRRKTEKKVSEVSLVCDVRPTSSSPSSPTLMTSSATDDPPSPPRNHVTVAKLQQWARQGAVAPPPSQSSAHRHSDPPSGTTQDAPGPVWRLQTPQPGPAPCGPAPPPGGAPLPGQRSYLQSLERSSRAWLLSSGRSSEEAGGPPTDGAANIWYNPIPEEEDTGGAGPDGRGGDMQGAEPTEGALEGSNPSVGYHGDEIRAEDTEASPTCQKKGGGASSVIDRLRSPGSVRKLSLKMKKLPELRRKLSLRSSGRAHRHGNQDDGVGKNASSALANQNVISRYHLDSSAPPARPPRRSSRGASASKGGYLSDGDSPELLPRQQTSPSLQDAACDVSSFRLYVGVAPPPRCSRRVSGLLTAHLLGLEEMKSSRSEDSKEVFVALQVDGVTRARTALLPLRGPALSLNHTFHLELERARQLRVVVLTPGVGGVKPDQSPPAGPARNRVCGLGGVSIPPLFKGSRSQQLCVKLEPRGLLYLKLSLEESWDTQGVVDLATPPSVFGVELCHLVDSEGTAARVPLLIQKSVTEIERRGLKVVGLYRLCGSAAVKKELRDWFERSSAAVCLSEDLYPDINVITGILKDFLRELPSPLITRTLYQAVREAMALDPPPAAPALPDPQLAQRTVDLLACLPPPERATLSLLLDHLSLVASFSSSNRMTHQNLAVCFGPVLLTPTQEAWRGAGGGAGSRGRGGGVGKVCGPSEEVASAVDFKRHIEALHYLLQLWPVPTHQLPGDDAAPPAPTHHLSGEREVVVSRRGRGGPARLDSPPPINRYAGDWSVCGGGLPGAGEDDYDEVAASESSEEEEVKEAWSAGAAAGGEGGGGAAAGGAGGGGAGGAAAGGAGAAAGGGAGAAGGGAAGGAAPLYVDEFLDFDAPFHCRLSLKDFDTLIHDLDRELAKQINICL